MDDRKLDTRLKELHVPAPREAARRRAMEDAMYTFDKAQENRTQGFYFASRLMGAAQAAFTQLTRSWSMKTSYIAIGGVAAVALAVSLSTSSVWQDIVPKKAADITTTTALTPVAPPAATPIPADANVTPLPPPQAEPPAPEEQRTRDESGMVVMDAAKPKVKTETLSTASKESFQDSKKSSQAMTLSAPAPASVAGGMVMQERASIAYSPPADIYYRPPVYEGQDKFEHKDSNPVKLVAQEPVSTFSVDVDTASYAFVRRAINNGSLPQPDAVRVEEMINYFHYNYALPEDKAQPFKPTVAIYPTPWNAETKLVHIGIKGYDVPAAHRHSNLVFLIDTSGSMQGQDRLPLVKKSLMLLLDTLSPDDTIGIVTYAGSAGVALEPTKVKDKAKILGVLEGLGAGGSTAGAEGIRTAYHLAEVNFDKKGVNRVILATDGDFNVGITDPEELKHYVEQQREKGIYLSILGFGQGNYNDALMQTLAQNGNGNAAYIDTLNEARKVLVEEAGSTLFTIAKDVKLQVEFNPATVAEYRLIGYETRQLKREDFNNDKVDAGDIGSGHTVTAIFEITPVGSKARLIDDSRYTKAETPKPVEGMKDEYAFLKIRYKLPQESSSKLLTTPITVKNEFASLNAAPEDIRFAAAVAGFGQLLKSDLHTKDWSYDDVITLASGAKGADNFGYRSEFVSLAQLAKALARSQMLEPTPGPVPVEPPQPILMRE